MCVCVCVCVSKSENLQSFYMQIRCVNTCSLPSIYEIRFLLSSANLRVELIFHSIQPAISHGRWIILCFVIDKPSQNLREFIRKQYDSFRWLFLLHCVLTTNITFVSRFVFHSYLIDSHSKSNQSTIHFFGCFIDMPYY